MTELPKLGNLDTYMYKSVNLFISLFAVCLFWSSCIPLATRATSTLYTNIREWYRTCLLWILNTIYEKENHGAMFAMWIDLGSHRHTTKCHRSISPNTKLLPYIVIYNSAQCHLKIHIHNSIYGTRLNGSSSMTIIWTVNTRNGEQRNGNKAKNKRQINLCLVYKLSSLMTHRPSVWYTATIRKERSVPIPCHSIHRYIFCRRYKEAEDVISRLIDWT